MKHQQQMQLLMGREFFGGGWVDSAFSEPAVLRVLPIFKVRTARARTF